MDMEINPQAWSQAGFSHPAGECDSRLDWPGLRSRLQAARAASLTPSRQPPASGSFDGGMARIIETYVHDLSDVNPTASGNGKPVGRNRNAAAETQASGGRG